ncbi:hypothetical protein EHS13_11790 [Paenibacillus psychroresistens]|uniref:Uncharacterized protein n=2 Tax=Paenibacillus psychroresistens TaxID=1778678 RepID=A0A6B8RWJ4_9BACL|nr:hypothetical protein EHS13_11790 [Paenibacillus psychroresistens]
MTSQDNNSKRATAPIVVLTEVSPSITATIAATDTIQETADPTPVIAVEKTLTELVEQYGKLNLSDAHNHDASDSGYLNMVETWKQDSVDRVIIFGDVSESSAMTTDRMAWEAYQGNPDFYIPYFSGFDLHDKSSLQVVRDNLEQGYFGLGEIAAASTNSPVLSMVEWKAEDPMDGFLPQIYDICAEYKAPILLHIDPPNGIVIDKLEEALIAHPDTIFIFAHANAFNSPENIQNLLEKHSNLYADFFAGFTDSNSASSNKLEDFIPVMKQFPNHFMLSTDSGFGLQSEETAIEGMYRLIDLLGDQDLAQKIAYDNLDAIIQKAPATKTQLDAIQKLSKKNGQTYDLKALTKFEAGKILVGV